MLAQRVHPVQSRQLCASKEGLVYSETENHVGQCQHSSLNISNHKAMVHKVVQRVPQKSKSCTIPAAAVAVDMVMHHYLPTVNPMPYSIPQWVKSTVPHFMDLKSPLHYSEKKIGRVRVAANALK